MVERKTRSMARDADMLGKEERFELGGESKKNRQSEG